MRKSSVLLILALLVSGCSDITGSSPPRMSGTWSGTSIGASNPVTITMTVLEERGKFTGWGSVRIQGPPTDFFAIGVSGVHVHPEVSFAGHLSGFEDFNFTGRFEDRSTIFGQLRGSGFQDYQIRMTREQ